MKMLPNLGQDGDLEETSEWTLTVWGETFLDLKMEKEIIEQVTLQAGKVTPQLVATIK
jgi:hypothetical protein